MTKRLVGFALIFIAPFITRGQLIFNPDDVWTYSFSTLSFGGTTIRSFPNYGSLMMTFSSFAAGATLQYEMFDGEPGDFLIRTGLITSGSSFSTAPALAFQDLAGSVRLTMLTGHAPWRLSLSAQGYPTRRTR
jgi:hypothetical protein